jgi:hypothetical protein
VQCAGSSRDREPKPRLRVKCGLGMGMAKIIENTALSERVIGIVA